MNYGYPSEIARGLAARGRGAHLLSAFDSCDQRCLGLRDPALKRDEGRIVERSAHGIRAVLAF